MVHYSGSAASKDRSDLRRGVAEGFALLLTSSSYESKYFTVSRQVVFEAMEKTPVLGSRRAAGEIEIILQKKGSID